MDYKLGYLSAYICSKKWTVFREVQGTDNVQGQISEHIFTPNGGYCVYYPSNLFRNAHSFENWGMFSDIPQFWLGNIKSHDMFRPIACKGKYLMDYKLLYSMPKEIWPIKIQGSHCILFIPRYYTQPFHSVPHIWSLILLVTEQSSLPLEQQELSMG